MKRLFASTVCVVVFIHAAATAAPNTAPKKALPRGEVHFSTARGNLPVRVEIATQADELARGLMYRTSLAPGDGMLFVFASEGIQSFWMKNTYVPLDMIFINTHKEVVGVVHDAEPLSLTPRRIDQPSRYVVEVAAGFARDNAIVPGVSVRFVSDLKL